MSDTTTHNISDTTTVEYKTLLGKESKKPYKCLILTFAGGYSKMILLEKAEQHLLDHLVLASEDTTAGQNINVTQG